MTDQEIAFLCSTCDKPLELCDHIESLLARCQIDCDDLRSDAERYRWLRENFTRIVVHTEWDSQLDLTRILAITINSNFRFPEKDSLDAAIDVAIANDGAAE